MSHRLGAVSSDYCSVCQNGLLPSAAATASNRLWPLAAPFLMTNCQPAPTKARLKCQHRMTKGPRGSSETNCVQYELILYSRAGAWLAAGCRGCWPPQKESEGRAGHARWGVQGPWALVCGEDEPSGLFGVGESETVCVSVMGEGGKEGNREPCVWV